METEYFYLKKWPYLLGNIFSSNWNYYYQIFYFFNSKICFITKKKKRKEGKSSFISASDQDCLITNVIVNFQLFYNNILDNNFILFFSFFQIKV